MLQVMHERKCTYGNGNAEIIKAPRGLVLGSGWCFAYTAHSP